MILPECQQLPVRTCSKDAPDRPPMRGGRCIGYFFPRESPGRTLAGGLASTREQESRALWLESQQPASSIFYDKVIWHGDSFLRCRAQWLQR